MLIMQAQREKKNFFFQSRIDTAYNRKRCGLDCRWRKKRESTGTEKTTFSYESTLMLKVSLCNPVVNNHQTCPPQF